MSATPVRGDVVEPGLERLLLSHPASPDTPILSWDDEHATLAELTAAAKALAGELTTLGVGPSSPVACVVTEGATAVAVMFATWLAGGVYVPVNGRLTDREVRALLADPAPAVVVTSAGESHRVPDALPCIEERGRWGWHVVRHVGGTPAVRLGGGTALLMRTSGTVAAPKAVPLRHDGVLLGIDTVIARLRSKPGKRPDGREWRPRANIIPTSLALWAGVWNTLFAFRIGAPVVLMDRFDTVRYADLVRRLGVRSTVLVPAMITALTDDERITDLTPLRYVRSITAHLRPEEARRFRDRFGVSVLNSYGQTELGSEVAGWTAHDVRQFGDGKLGSVGRLHPGVDLLVIDENGRPAAPGTVGELYIRSPFIDQGEGAASLGQERLMDGYVRSGDLGYLDDDGFLWIEGRVSDMINRGGLKIMPGEVEDALRALPGIADACVAGIPDPRLGEVPFAWLVAADSAPLDVDHVRERLRGVLAGYKIPVGFALVDEFPRSEIGKVLRRELVRRHAATVDRPGDQGGERRAGARLNQP